MDNKLAGELLIYTPEITPRIAYIVQTLSGGKAKLSADLAAAMAHEGPLINYSAIDINSGMQIRPHGLLTENGIREQEVDCIDWNGLTAFFATRGDISFDFFSAAFFLLTRYEEYLPHNVDQYGRYAHLNSVAYKNNFLHLPLVNLWMREIDLILQQRYPGISFRFQHSKFRYIPSYDVDIAYAYWYQPPWKNIGGFFRDLLQGNTAKVIERGNVYAGRKADPFDTFSWLDDLHAKCRLKPAYFLLAIVRRGKYDKNLPASSTALQRLYKRLASVYVTGLHPSWQSGEEAGLLEKEKITLEKMVGHKVFVSRNHYLRFNLPHSYRALTAAGITDDHSMAYGSINGFRASYALPFRWYDLEREEVTQLVVHPFCFMEAAAYFEQHLTAEAAGKELQAFYEVVRSVEGEFVTLFHNHFLTEMDPWGEWREMYRAFLERNFGG